MTSTYVSAVPLTMVRLVDGGYRNVLEGDPIEGEAVDPDDLKRLVRKKFLTKLEAAAKKAAEADESKPASVKDILADVGDDKGKAAAALEAENARGDDARPSLVSKLEAIVNADES